MVVVLSNNRISERKTTNVTSSSFVLPCLTTRTHHGNVRGIASVTTTVTMLMTIVLLVLLLVPLQHQSHFSFPSPAQNEKPPPNSKNVSPQQTSINYHRGHGDDNGSADGGGNKQQHHGHNEDDDDNDDEKPPILYSKARPDRSGAAIQDMLFAHAFAFSENVTYGGACNDVAEEQQLQQSQQQQKKNMLINEDNLSHPLTAEQILEHQKDQQDLIQMLGLQNILPFACPKDQRRGIIMNRFDYYQQDTKIWSREWIQHIQSIVTYYDDDPTPRTPKAAAAASVLQIAVHVRRGDVTPCSTYASTRYLPNSYYLNVLDMYLPQNETYEVSIYSDGKINDNDSSSLEGWESFIQRNYSMKLDTTALDAWKAFMTADIFVMSKSSMSLVAAMLNTNRRKNINKKNSTIIYTPFWHHPLEDWRVVQGHLVQSIQTEVERLQQQLTCPSYQKV